MEEYGQILIKEGLAIAECHPSKNVTKFIARIEEQNKNLRYALQEISDCETFAHYNPLDCTEEIFEDGQAIVQTARDALREGE